MNTIDSSKKRGLLFKLVVALLITTFITLAELPKTVLGQAVSENCDTANFRDWKVENLSLEDGICKASKVTTLLSKETLFKFKVSIDFRLYGDASFSLGYSATLSISRNELRLWHPQGILDKTLGEEKLALEEARFNHLEYTYSDDYATVNLNGEEIIYSKQPGIAGRLGIRFSDGVDFDNLSLEANWIHPPISDVSDMNSDLMKGFILFRDGDYGLSVIHPDGTGEQKFLEVGSERFYEFHFSRDGQFVSTSNREGINIYNFSDQSLVKSFNVTDGTRYAWSSTNTLFLWNPLNTKPIFTEVEIDTDHMITHRLPEIIDTTSFRAESIEGIVPSPTERLLLVELHSPDNGFYPSVRYVYYDLVQGECIAVSSFYKPVWLLNNRSIALTEPSSGGSDVIPYKKKNFFYGLMDYPFTNGVETKPPASDEPIFNGNAYTHLDGSANYAPDLQHSVSSFYGHIKIIGPEGKTTEIGAGFNAIWQPIPAMTRASTRANNIESRSVSYKPVISADQTALTESAIAEKDYPTNTPTADARKTKTGLVLFGLLALTAIGLGGKFAIEEKMTKASTDPDNEHKSKKLFMGAFLSLGILMISVFILLIIRSSYQLKAFDGISSKETNALHQSIQPEPTEDTLFEFQDGCVPVDPKTLDFDYFIRKIERQYAEAFDYLSCHRGRVSFNPNGSQIFYDTFETSGNPSWIIAYDLQTRKQIWKREVQDFQNTAPIFATDGKTFLLKGNSEWAVVDSKDGSILSIIPFAQRLEKTHPVLRQGDIFIRPLIGNIQFLQAQEHTVVRETLMDETRMLQYDKTSNVVVYHQNGANRLSPDGKVYASLGEHDGTGANAPGLCIGLTVWDTQTGKILWQLDKVGDRYGISFSPDSHFLLLSGWGGQGWDMQVYQTATGKSLGSIGEEGQTVEELFWSMNSDYLAYESDGIIYVADKFLSLHNEISLQQFKDFYIHSWTPDDRILISVYTLDQDMTKRRYMVLDPRTGKMIPLSSTSFENRVTPTEDFEPLVLPSETDLIFRADNPNDSLSQQTTLVNSSTPIATFAIMPTISAPISQTLTPMGFDKTPKTTITTPTPTKITSCPGAPVQKVKIGKEAVVCTKSDPLRLRVEPGKSSAIIANINPGVIVMVIDGPECYNGWSWWKVRLASGREGWVAEGGDHIDPYFICPRD